MFHVVSTSVLLTDTRYAISKCLEMVEGSPAKQERTDKTGKRGRRVQRQPCALQAPDPKKGIENENDVCSSSLRCPGLAACLLLTLEIIRFGRKPGDDTRHNGGLSPSETTRQGLGGNHENYSMVNRTVNYPMTILASSSAVLVGEIESFFERKQEISSRGDLYYRPRL